MALYNRNFDKLDINIEELVRINEMITNSFIYKYRDMIIKKYWTYTEFTIKEEVFDILCDINNKHFINLYELYTIKADWDTNREFSIDGYTAQYYKNDDINPLLESNDYLLSNIIELKELVDLLTDKGILMKDTKRNNCIIQNDGIVLIDPDYYEISNLNYNRLRKFNYRELLNLIKTIFFKYYEDKDNLYKFFEEFRMSKPIESIEHMEKCLKKVRKPIYLINK